MLIFLLTEEYLLSLSEAPGDANTYDTLTLPHDRNLVRGHRTGSTKSGVEEHLREKKKKLVTKTSTTVRHTRAPVGTQRGVETRS